MASDGVQALPADLWHLITAELADRAIQAESQELARPEYAALCNCILSSKFLASAGALVALYRIALHDRSPVKGGGGENISFAEQDVMVMKWSVLWRTIVLSTLGKTFYPYCRHLRGLDLRDLSWLLDRLDEPKFRGKVAKQFFAGDLSRFHILIETPAKTPAKTRAARLDIKKILLAVGDEITKHSPLLEELLEPSTSDVLITALPTWTPRLEHLRALEFWDGKLLADETIRNLLHVHCPNLAHLQLFLSTDPESDHHLALFINGLQHNNLLTFENNSTCNIGQETCMALNNHGRSLFELKLGLEEQGMLALGLLKDMTALKTLHITGFKQSADLKATQNDVFRDIVEWLRGCTMLADVSFDNILSAPDLMIPILEEGSARLRHLSVTGKEGSLYVLKDHHHFHRALKHQLNLESLVLRADPDPVSRDDIEILMATITSLKQLKRLDLFRTSDYFSNDQIIQLAQSLPMLETLYIGGYGISDAVLHSVAHLANLRSVTFAGITAFTTDGLLDFVNELPDRQSGLVIAVEMADPDSMIPEEGQKLIADSLATKVGGRFEYQPLRASNHQVFDRYTCGHTAKVLWRHHDVRALPFEALQSPNACSRPPNSSIMKRILVIAGSDSSGGAGLEADQKAIAAHRCYAMTATTALTAQNTQGVSGIHETPPDFVRKQIDACVADIGVDVVKTGMLASAETVNLVAESLQKYELGVSVVDPVMVATSGAQLLPEKAVKVLCDRLLPVTFLLTPNIPEANLILKEAGEAPVEVNDKEGLKRLAAAVQRLGPKHVLLKGGHLPLTAGGKLAKSAEDKKFVANVLTGPDFDEVVELPYQESGNTHGTGCTLASAIACRLAEGYRIDRAVRMACRYVEAGIKTSVDLGRGSGPLNHFHSTQSLPFPPDGFIQYLLEREDVQPAWHDYTHHEFVQQMGDGTLPPETFKYYMIQDYLYLVQFARANALAGYKAKTLDDIAGSEDWLALQVALLPCLLGYGMIAQRLHEMQVTHPPNQPNRYLSWINNYIAEDYTEAMETGFWNMAASA
ncbi:hypothetical protein D0868_13556 [Hortaea werneckii]|uniref:Pyridoxamine kinase/Phosphomethylpyrimidine kinase domain-containing protein n=1 Tax=Hortaea werneckii TaxID=91943 RepID=A0A3M6XMZ5_HORWE|nr:hypothetical protein D0868_13556 [Hortaea werneckii]